MQKFQFHMRTIRAVPALFGRPARASIGHGAVRCVASGVLVASVSGLGGGVLNRTWGPHTSD